MEWEYQSHSKYPVSLIIKTEELLELISNEQFDIAELIVDTRKVHRHLFLDLTPSGYEYFAGHYRGEQFPELENYEIVAAPRGFARLLQSPCCSSSDAAFWVSHQERHPKT